MSDTHPQPVTCLFPDIRGTMRVCGGVLGRWIRSR